jgi:hypothetical protein
MELFDIVKNIFSTNDKIWKGVNRNDKARNFFMINRIMSIQYPIQANQFNRLKVSPPFVVDWWRDTLNKRYSKSPSWIFTKTKKKQKEKDSKEIEIKGEVEDFVRQKFQISQRDLETIKKFYPDRYKSWIRDISEQLGLIK